MANSCTKILFELCMHVLWQTIYVETALSSSAQMLYGELTVEKLYSLYGGFRELKLNELLWRTHNKNSIESL